MAVDYEEWLPYGAGDQSRGAAFFYDEIANDNEED